MRFLAQRVRLHDSPPGADGLFVPFLPDKPGHELALGAQIKPLQSLPFPQAPLGVDALAKYTLIEGDGLLQKSVPALSGYTMSTYMPAASFELPAALDIGAAYNFDIGDITRLTLAANFRSNSFGKDQFIGGLELSLKDILMLRGGYTYEEGITQKKDRTTVYTGPSAGVTVKVPLSKEKESSFAVDYSFRSTDPFTGIHTVGIIFAF